MAPLNNFVLSRRYLVADEIPKVDYRTIVDRYLDMCFLLQVRRTNGVIKALVAIRLNAAELQFGVVILVLSSYSYNTILIFLLFRSLPCWRTSLSPTSTRQVTNHNLTAALIRGSLGWQPLRNHLEFIV